RVPEAPRGHAEPAMDMGEHREHEASILLDLRRVFRDILAAAHMAGTEDIMRACAKDLEGSALLRGVHVRAGVHVVPEPDLVLTYSLRLNDVVVSHLAPPCSAVTLPTESRSLLRSSFR